MREAGI